MLSLDPVHEYHRDQRIIDLATEYLGVDWDRLRGRSRDQDIVEARQLFCYLLSRAGYTVAAIARLLERNHSTILHAIRRVEQSNTLIDVGRSMTGAVLPLLADPNEQVTLGTLPMQAIAQSVLRSLLGTTSLRDVRAVRAYVCGPLLGRERVPAVLAAWGLCVLVSRPTVRARVEEVLHACGLPAYCGLLDLQVRQAGMR